MVKQKLKLWIFKWLRKDVKPTDIEKLTPEARAIFCNDCKFLKESQTLQMLFKNLIAQKENYIARQASNRPFQVTEGELERYGIIILEEFQEKINLYASQVEEKETFNKFDLL